ncbi:MAG: hypothetical protein RSD19_03710, partial [Oscillospiraceae bacterium]
MIIISGIRIPLGAEVGEAESAALRMLGAAKGSVLEKHVRRVSFDARHGGISQVCSVSVTLNDSEAEKRLSEANPSFSLAEKMVYEPIIGSQNLNSRPVVIGFGPAGIFAAYLLAKNGYRPIVLERGADMEKRVRAVEGFFSGGEFSQISNVQFGEGGAGTFSDGKLTTRINDPRCDFVLDTFVKFGAPEEILIRQKPHIGTDRLRGIVSNIRTYIESCGGEIHFESCVDDIVCQNGRVTALECGGERFEAEAAVLACGHSARDTFTMLSDKPVILTAKPFSVGLRVEHLQSDIDRALYGRFAGDARLPHGEYALSAKVGGRGVYTFCMCPGGSVVAASSEDGGIVTNGMSNSLRDKKNANSAVAVSVDSRDFGYNPFKAIDMQRSIERSAYAAAGGGFTAPAQDMRSFLSGAAAALEIDRIEPTYQRKVAVYKLEKLFGNEIGAA